MHSQSVWVILYIYIYIYIIRPTVVRKPTGMGAIDSGRRPQHSGPGLGRFLTFVEDPVSGERGHHPFGSQAGYILLCEQDERRRSHGRRHLPLPAAVACRQGRGLGEPSHRHGLSGDTTATCPLLVSRRAEPAAQPLDTRAQDEHACCGSIPHVSVCELKKLGRAARLLNSSCGLQPDFPGLSISHVMASCMQRTVCCCR